MTQQEFDTAVVTLEHNGWDSIEWGSIEMKVFAAACQVMRRWLNIPDNETLGRSEQFRIG